MDFFKIKAEIDTKISTRPSNKFGIKVGGELYKELANAGLIEMTEFSAYGGSTIAQFRILR